MKCRALAICGEREGALGGYGAIAERVSDELSGRGELCGVPVRAALAAGVCLSGLRRGTRSILEEPGAHLRMPRLRSPDVDNRRDGDAPVEVAADGVVVGRASHGDALEWHVRQSSSRPSSASPTRRLGCWPRSCDDRCLIPTASRWRAWWRSTKLKFLSGPTTAFSIPRNPRRS